MLQQNGASGGNTSSVDGRQVDSGDDSETPGGRWGLRGKKGKSLLDNPLVSAFTKLRNDLKGCKGL